MEKASVVSHNRCLNRCFYRYLAVLLILGVILSGMCPVQIVTAAESESAPEVQFQQTYGGAGEDTAYAVEVTEDGGYALGGITYVSNRTEAWLVKTHKNGDKEWEKSYAYLDSFGLTEIRAMDQVLDGGFIMAGSVRASIGNMRKVYLLRTQANGDKIWESTFYLEHSKIKWENCQAFSVEQTNDLGFIIAGMVQYGQQSDMYLIKVDYAGNKEWERIYGGATWDWAYSVKQTTDGGFIIAGSTDDSKKLYLIKTDGQGLVDWEKTYTVSGMAVHAKSVCETKDGGFAVSGYKGSNVYLMKTNAGGSKKWDRTYGNGIGYSVCQLKSGDFVIAGGIYGADGVYIVHADDNGIKLWDKTVGLTGDIGYSVKQAKDGGIIIAGSKNQAGTDGYLIKLPWENESVLGISSESIIKDGSVLLYTTVFGEDEERDVSGSVDVKVKYKQEDGSEKELLLKDDGTDGDFHEKDGVYSSWYKAAQTADLTFELYVKGILADSKEIKMENTPELIVITNLKALYDEFLDIGAKFDDDTNKNKSPDYYDLLDRINQYAGDHKGVVLDVSREISVKNGQTDDYDTLTYKDASVAQGQVIDQYIFKVSQLSEFKYVAIIGDDEVVPFFRKKDPTANIDPTATPPVDDGEHTYPRDDLKNNFGNRALVDSRFDNILTDVPYGSYEETDRNLPDNPLLDAGVGRIFADKPSELIGIIDGYETDIVLTKDVLNAVIFGGHNELKDKPAGPYDWPSLIKSTLVDVMPRELTKDSKPIVEPPYLPGHYYWYDGEKMNWSAKSVTDAIPAAKITLYWNHADHMSKMTRRFPALESYDYDAMSEAPGHLLITPSCHSGYSISHNNELDTTKSFRAYTRAMVNSIMRKKVTYIAPTTYGLGIGQDGHVAYHDFLLQNFFKNLLAGDSTIGQVQVKTYSDFWALMDPRYSSAENTYSAYGTEVYGLPTQKVRRTGSASLKTRSIEENSKRMSLKLQDEDIAPIAKSAGTITETLEFSLEIPEFHVTKGEDGKAVFDIPNGSLSLINSYAPLVPMVSKTLLLPKDMKVEAVSLNTASTETSVYGESVELKALIPVNKTKGPMSGTFSLPAIYPQELFWWVTEDFEEGTLLRVNITPLQYENETGLVTLYNKLDFTVNYSGPASGVSITDMEVNNGNTVSTGQEDIPVTLQVISDTAEDMILNWSIKDYGGFVLDSGYEEVYVTEDGEVTFHTATSNINPGPKDFTAVLLKDGQVAAGKTATVQVSGIRIEAAMAKYRYFMGEASAQLNVKVYDEDGRLVTGLTEDSFTLKLDGAPVSPGITYNAASSQYELQFPIEGFEEGIHSVDITCRDERGLDQSFVLTFELKTDTAVPMVKSTSPTSYEPGVGVNTDIKITFNEEILAGVAFEDILLTVDGMENTFAASIGEDNIVLIPDTALPFGKTCIVTIPAGTVTDLAGNQNAPYSFQYTTATEPDTTPPAILRTSPRDGMEGVVTSASIQISFNETIKEGGAYEEISLTAGDVEIPFTKEVVWKNIIITPKTALPYNTQCRVMLPTGAVRDLAGNENTAGLFSFTTAYNEDITPPEVLLTYPSDGTTDVIASPVINLFLSEIVAEGQSFGNIRILKQAGEQEIPVACTATISGNLLTIQPENELDYNTFYRVMIPANACRDIVGNNLGSEYSLSFATGRAVDIDGPRAISVSPADNEEGIPVYASVYSAVTVAFDEITQIGSAFDNITLKRGEEPVQITQNVGGSLLTIYPSVPLDYGTSYIVEIPEQAVTDAVYNPLGSMLQYSFTTEDGLTPPKLAVQATSPVNNGINASTDTGIYVAFNESIREGDNFGGIELLTAGGSIEADIQIIYNMLTIIPKESLPYSTLCTVTLPAGAITDMKERQLPDGFRFSFATEGAPDNVAPQLEAVIPGNGHTGVQIGAPVTLFFNENLRNELNIADISFTSEGGAVPFRTEIIGCALIIYPESSLSYGSVYSVSLAQGAVLDLYGNPLSEWVQIDFTTQGGSDSAPPQMVETSPPDNAINVVTDVNIYLEYDESINAGTGFTNIKLLKTTGGNEEAQEYSVPYKARISGSLLIIELNERLSEYTGYTLVVPSGSIADLSGNETDLMWSLQFTTGAAPDTTSPEATETQPQQGAVGVDTGELIAIHFSEAVRAGNEFSDIALMDENSPVPVVVNLNNETMTLFPENYLDYDKTYRVFLPKGSVTDLAGNKLITDFSFMFTTGEAPPLPPPPADTGGGPVSGGSKEPERRVINRQEVKKGTYEILAIEITDEEIEEGIIVLPEALQEMLSSSRDLELVLSSGNMRITAALVRKLLEKNSEGNLSIRLTEVDNETGILSLKPDLQHTGRLIRLEAAIYKGDWIEEVREGLALEMPAEEVPEPWRLQAYGYDGSEWQFIGGSLSEDGKNIMFTIGSFDCYGIMEDKTTFDDTAGHWAKEDIERLSVRQIIKGYTNGLFYPERNLTRAEMAVLLDRILQYSGIAPDSTAGTEAAFGDVPMELWCAEAISRVYKAGLMIGTSQNSFDPYAPLTKEQAALIMDRFRGMIGEPLSGELSDEVLASFKDEGNISSWAREALLRCFVSGIINGTPDKRLTPLKEITRAEIASMLRRAEGR